jgi:hypothetical protein
VFLPLLPTLLLLLLRSILIYLLFPPIGFQFIFLHLELVVALHVARTLAAAKVDDVDELKNAEGKACVDGFLSVVQVRSGQSYAPPTIAPLKEVVGITF